MTARAPMESSQSQPTAEVAKPENGDAPPLAGHGGDAPMRHHRRVFRNTLASMISMLASMASLVIMGLWMVDVKSSETTPEMRVNVSPTETVEPTMALDTRVQASTETFAAADLPANAAVSLSELSGITVDPTRGFLKGCTGNPRRGGCYDNPMDRLTQELLLMSARQKVLVIWVFDESASMKDDQRQIRDRIERVYTELRLSNLAKGDTLLTAVTSYGAEFHVYTEEPTTDLSTILKAIDNVPIDNTGKEATCLSLGKAITHYRRLATGRRIALVLVSDESGDRADNDVYLEPLIEECKSIKATAYVIGREAVFGYPHAHFSWVHPVTKHAHWLPVDRGPETAFAEQLQTDGFRRRYDAHASGFGPFEYSRLARETGGIFFMLPGQEANIVRGENRKYELEAMRAYKPDLRAKVEQKLEIDSSPLRTGVLQVIHDLNPWRPEIAKEIEMVTQFSPDPKEFAQQVANEQKKAVVYLQHLEQAIDRMNRMQALLAHEYSPRWQANFDLIHGQLYAYTVRIHEYCAGLEEFRRNPKIVPLTKPPQLILSHWEIVTRPERLTGEKGAEYVEKANALFAKVIKHHPGTPWAARAESEIYRGYGVGLTEAYRGPQPVGNGPRLPIPEL